MAPLYCFQWDYDAVGNRTYEKRGETDTYYAYDARGRGTAASIFG